MRCLQEVYGLMPRYDYMCRAGHAFEAYVPVAQVDRARCCPQCGASASVVVLEARSLITVTPLVNEVIYREHNVTRTELRGSIKAEPNPPSLQCQCGDCAAHRRRAAMTGVAEPGKVR